MIQLRPRRIGRKTHQNNERTKFFIIILFYFGHANNYNTLHLQFFTINSNCCLLNFTLH